MRLWGAVKYLNLTIHKAFFAWLDLLLVRFLSPAAASALHVCCHITHLFPLRFSLPHNIAAALTSNMKDCLGKSLGALEWRMNGWHFVYYRCPAQGLLLGVVSVKPMHCLFWMRVGAALYSANHNTTTVPVYTELSGFSHKINYFYGINCLNPRSCPSTVIRKYLSLLSLIPSTADNSRPSPEGKKTLRLLPRPVITQTKESGVSVGKFCHSTLLCTIEKRHFGRSVRNTR